MNRPLTSSRSNLLVSLHHQPSAIAFKSFGLRDDRAIRTKPPVAVLKMKAAGTHFLKCPSLATASHFVKFRRGAGYLRHQREHRARLPDAVGLVAELTAGAGELRRPG